MMTRSAARISMLFVLTAAVATIAGFGAASDVRLRIDAGQINTEGRAWSLTLDEDRHLVVRTGGMEVRRRIDRAQRDQIARILTDQHFLELAESYGVSLMGGPIRSMLVTLNGKRNGVELYADLPLDARRGEIERALTACAAIEDLVAMDTPVVQSCRRDQESLRRLGLEP